MYTIINVLVIWYNLYHCREQVRCAAVRLKVELIKGVDHQPIEGFIVKLAQNHVDDFVNLWLNQLRASEKARIRR